MGDFTECGFQVSAVLSGIGEVSKKIQKEAIPTQGEVGKKKNWKEKVDL